MHKRTGVVLGMRRSEVQVAAWQSNLLKITVYEHKTGRVKPATIFLEKMAGDAIIKFSKEILPKIAKNNDDYNFFLSFNGKNITQDGLQSSLNSLIKLTGSTVKITPTKSRAAAATFIAKNNPENSQIVADFMQHEASTAEKFYRQHGGGSHFSTAYEAIGRMNTKEA